MNINHTNNHGKHTDESAKLAEAARATINRTAQAGSQAADSARAGVEQAGATAKQTMQAGVETVSHHMREATDRFTRGLGFSGEHSERFAQQSKENMEAVTSCGTVLTQAFRDASRGWFELGQKQWQRNLDGLNKLTASKSVQEFAAVQSDLLREGLQHMVQDSRAIAETSLRAVDDASKTFSSVAHQNSHQGSAGTQR